MANGVVSGVRGKRPHRDYHSQEAPGEVWPAQPLRVLATHFRGQATRSQHLGSNYNPGLSYGHVPGLQKPSGINCLRKDVPRTESPGPAPGNRRHDVTHLFGWRLRPLPTELRAPGCRVGTPCSTPSLPPPPTPPPYPPSVAAACYAPWMCQDGR
ncbi:unnamed protein product [Lota lota]